MLKEFSRVFLKDKSGDFLVIRDREGIWNIPGGKQELGESPSECAIREVHEETSLIISNLEEIYCSNLKFDNVEWRGHFFFANMVEGLPTLNEPNKIKGVQFITKLDEVNYSNGLSPLFSFLSENNILESKYTKWI